MLMGAKDKKIFIYVGPHKSGGLFLCSRIFPNIRGCYDVRTRRADITYMISDAVEENPLFLDIEELKKKVYSRLSVIEEENIVLSSSDYFGTYDRMISPAMYHSKQFADNKRYTEILASVFPNAKLIMTPRRQDSWVDSCYRSLLRGGETVTVEEFLNPRCTDHTWNYNARSIKPCCDVKTLDWEVYVRNYYEIFGKDNVLVLPYELMIHNLDEFLDRLYRFMGVEPYFPETVKRANRGYSALSVKVAFLLNRFIHSRGNRVGFIPNRPFFWYLLKRRDRSLLFRVLTGISSRMSLRWFLQNVVERFYYRQADPLGPERKREILEYYMDRNKQYARLIGIDLAPYGYY